MQLGAVYRVHKDSPLGHVLGLVVQRDDVGDCRARVLDLDSPVLAKGSEGDGAVGVERVGAMLEDNNALDAVRHGTVAFKAVQRLLPEAVVGAIIAHVLAIVRKISRETHKE